MKKCTTCNICNCENEFDNSNPAVKNEYYNSDISQIPELAGPTVDFCAPNNMKHQNPFAPHYMFLIDITNFSFQFGLPSYVKLKIIIGNRLSILLTLTLIISTIQGIHLSV